MTAGSGSRAGSDSEWFHVRKQSAAVGSKKHAVLRPDEEWIRIRNAICLLEAARENWLDYKEIYMEPTLALVQQKKYNFWLRLPGFRGPRENCSFWINVILLEDSGFPNEAYAETVSAMNGDDYEAFIFISNALTSMTNEDQKFYLAHEWLEAVRRFKSPDENPDFLHDLNRVALLEQLGESAPWFDSLSYEQALKEALGILLVSQESVASYLSDEEIFGDGGRVYTAIRDEQSRLAVLSKLLSDRPDLFRSLLEKYSSEMKVHKEIVRLRLIEIFRWST